MAYDARAFERHYLGERASAATAPYRVVGVQADRVRAAVDVVLTDAAGRRLVVFCERRVPGAECLAATTHLNVSYYAEAGVDSAEAARVTRALAAALAAREAELSDAELAEVLTFSGREIGNPRRALELRINRECNEACAFCNTPADSETLLVDPAGVEALLRAEAATGCRAVLFTGREPTLEPRLPRYLELARSLGYEHRRVQTNGTSFASPEVVARLTAAGMNEVEVSFHTTSEETFERLVGKRHLLDRTAQGIRNVLAAGLRCQLIVVITRWNAREVPALVGDLRRRFPGLERVVLSPVAPVGDAAARPELWPPLGELGEVTSAALRAARAAGLAAHVPSRCGLPLCLLEPDVRDASDELENAPGETVEAGKAYAPACARCAERGRCTGVWAAYLAELGDTALRPLAEAALAHRDRR
ncbi:MAG: radical SAM protein [Polyangiaceae bacterium]|nr:radical SAM protein [Polyangiaceae bacterium]